MNGNKVNNSQELESNRTVYIPDLNIPSRQPHNDDLYNKTQGYITPSSSSSKSARYITIFEGDHAPILFDLHKASSNEVTFGRGDSSFRPDIQFSTGIVSRKHGCFYREGSSWYIKDLGSTNGIQYCGSPIQSREINNGDLYRIDYKENLKTNGVLIIITAELPSGGLEHIELKTSLVIGRSDKCDVILPHVSVSREHAIIEYIEGRWYIRDNHSTNGVLVNGEHIQEQRHLHEKDVITIVDTRLVFTSSGIYVYRIEEGINVAARNIVVKRGSKEKPVITTDHVDLDIKPGELVAIVGGSGAGKSTIMNVLSGYLHPSEGHVFINGVDLYRNFNALKSRFGYVPQSDIVYDNLTLRDMLYYTAKLRLPDDISDTEIEHVIDHAIDMVGLNEKKELLIKSLSGGQKKRASIAVELLADPGLLFLDEPTSGLDPGTEKSLMTSLRRMTREGKTVVLVTHSTLQLEMCDKILFMGKGGKLCFFGSLDKAKEFFKTNDIVSIYDETATHAENWKQSFRTQNPPEEFHSFVETKEEQAKKPNPKKLRVLCERYVALMKNDRKRLALLFLQAPLLALLMAIVANGEQFQQYEMTKSLLFALSCSGFWIGMLNAIQEICKERSILKREYMAGLSLTQYLLSKVIVLGGICAIQSFMLVTVFSIAVGSAEEGVILSVFFEMYLTTLFSTLAATGIGLFVSSLFSNPDRAMTVAPLLLMPQMLFSGLLFELSGVTECISWLTVCRWSMEGYGSTCDLNSLSLKLQQSGIFIEHKAEDFFTRSGGHMIRAWFLLSVFVAVTFFASRYIIKKIEYEDA